ncbi:uncharacterized protein K441DRAFT_546314, partial [Cenococcum geophilum 1.58]|uniref:uncharacterized protein n=1 Tax=Cenococcum geophilum 1.58 TaxID=794803 RepID=UPI00358E7F23
TYAISSAINHLKKEINGHGIIKEGPVITICLIAKKRKLIKMLQSLYNIPQQIANKIIGNFNMKKFRNAVVY